VAKGLLALVLHAHLPFVRHPEYEEFLEESWLYEAITETYIPLLRLLERAVQDQIPCRLTLSLSPPLLNMLDDALLQDRYVRRLERLIALAAKETARTRSDLAFYRLAQMYLELFTQARATFVDHYHCNLPQAFRQLQDAGVLEIMSCAATHGYLPLLHVNEKAVRAQVRIGIDEYQRFFTRAPAGIWLPECGYYPGLDEILQAYGIRYFIVDTHAIMYATPRPVYATYAPVYCPSGVAAYGRDADSSKQVWSSHEGYPGDPQYRDFYRDIGYDLDEAYIRPYLPPPGDRVPLGIKYYRITGHTNAKAPYDPQQARERATEHARHFVAERTQHAERFAEKMDRPPLMVAPYDAELFGHWWFEGPWWLESVIRQAAAEPGTLQLITPAEYLQRFPTNQIATPAASSWGAHGYHAVWLSDANRWIYRHLHQAADRMVELAARFPQAEGLQRRALDQAARELLLAQSSDWAFLIEQGTAPQYATARVKQHLSRFTQLYETLCADRLDEAWLSTIASQDNIFPAVDYRVYR
jgi:1,4-alpha-glucan branching enzyme